MWLIYEVLRTFWPITARKLEGGDTACTDVVGIGRFSGIRNWLLKEISCMEYAMIWFWISFGSYHEIYRHIL